MATVEISKALGNYPTQRKLIWKDRGATIDVYFAAPKGASKTSIVGGPPVDIETSTCRVTSVYGEL